MKLGVNEGVERSETSETSGAAGQGSVRVGKKGPTLSYTTLHYPDQQQHPYHYFTVINIKKCSGSFHRAVMYH